MTKKPTTLDNLFREEEGILERRARERREQAQTPEGRAETERFLEKRRKEIEKEIRQGLRDENGDWIEQPETDDEGDQGDEDEGGDDGDD